MNRSPATVLTMILAYTSTLTTTATATVAANVASTTMITHGVKETAATTYWILQGMRFARVVSIEYSTITYISRFHVCTKHPNTLIHTHRRLACMFNTVVMAIIFTSVVFFLLITLTTTGYCLMNKNTTIRANKGVSVVLPQPRVCSRV